MAPEHRETYGSCVPPRTADRSGVALANFLNLIPAGPCRCRLQNS
ncbi:MAG: hypothetical protein ACLSFT_06980 [Ruminococcus callidus]